MRQRTENRRAVQTHGGGATRAGRLALAALPLLVWSSVAAAQEEEAQDNLSGTAKLGYAATTGNAESSNLTASLATTLSLENWRHEASAQAFRATAQDDDTGDVETTAERYQLGYQANWIISPRSYLFARLNFDRDLFSGFSRQFSETVGYGYTFLDYDRHLLQGEIGVGAQQAKRNDNTTLSQVIGRATLTWNWAFSENGSFNQQFNLESGPTNTQLEAISELKARLVGGVSMGLSYTVRNNSDVPADSASTDTFTAITLQYDF